VAREEEDARVVATHPCGTVRCLDCRLRYYPMFPHDCDVCVYADAGLLCTCSLFPVPVPGVQCGHAKHAFAHICIFTFSVCAHMTISRRLCSARVRHVLLCRATALVLLAARVVPFDPPCSGAR
jgi:hypothetical protein